MPPKISIIVPCYNAAKYLPKSLDSILANTFTDYELILINDGSKDDTLAVLRRYEAKDGRIRVINFETNMGAAHGRRTGIMESRGDFIAFIDSDDWVEPNHLDVLYDKVRETPDIDIVAMYGNVWEYRFYSFKGDGMWPVIRQFGQKPVEITPCHPILKGFFGHTMVNIAPWNKLYRRTLLQEYPVVTIFNEEDTLLNLYAYGNARKIVSFVGHTYHYRTGGGSSCNPRVITDYVKSIYYKQDWLEANKSWFEGIDTDKEYMAYCYVELKNYIYYFINRTLVFEGPWKSTKEKLRKIFYDAIATDEIIGLLSKTRDTLPESYGSEDFQTLLTRDFEKVFARAKGRTKWYQYLTMKIRRMFSY